MDAAEKENLWLGEVVGAIRAAVCENELWKPIGDLAIEAAYNADEPRNAVRDVLSQLRHEIGHLEGRLHRLNK